MMTSAAVALKAPLASEPMLDALRALTHRNPLDRVDRDDATAVARPGMPASTAVEAPTVAEAVTVQQPAVAWVEPRDNLWLLSLKNYGLTLATFGIYHFWGRAEMNRQTVNAIHIDGQPLDYTGTGKEGFVSFVFGAVIAISVVSLFAYLFLMGGAGAKAAPTLEGIRSFRWQRLFISLPLLFLLGSITYRKRHHILRRTWLNGERFSLNGHAWSYAWRHFWSALLVPLTFGWAAPWRASMLEARKISEMQYGNQRFSAAPQMKSLYRAFALVWFGGGFVYVATLVALSFSFGPQLLAAINGLTFVPLKSWDIAHKAFRIIGVATLPMLTVVLLYRKAWLEHQISTIGFASGRLQLKLPTLRYLAVTYSGLALSILSLGCFHPVSRARFLKFVVNHVRVDGKLRLDASGAAGSVNQPSA